MKKIKNVLFIVMTVLALVGFMLICICVSIREINLIYRLPILGVILILPLVISACWDAKEISNTIDVSEQAEKEYENYKKSEREKIIKNALEKIEKSADEVKEKIKNWDWDEEK